MNPTPTSILGGTVTPPVSMSPIGFFNIILKIVYITAGIYVFFNFIVAGFRFLAGSDKPETITQVKDIILKSLIGLLIIVLSVVFAALIGWLFYDDPTAILAPKLQLKEEICEGCQFTPIDRTLCNTTCQTQGQSCVECNTSCRTNPAEPVYKCQ